MIEAEGEQRLQEQWEKTQDSILRAKKGLEDLQNETVLVMGLSRWASRQQKELEALVTSDDFPQKENKGTLGATGLVPVNLTSYSSSESLQDFDIEEIDTQHYWYYAIKAERIKMKMDQATKVFNERDKACQDLAQYDQAYAEYEKYDRKFHQQLVTIKDILSKHETE